MSFVTGPIAGALAAGSVRLCYMQSYHPLFHWTFRYTMDFRASSKNGERKIISWLELSTYAPNPRTERHRKEYAFLGLLLLRGILILYISSLHALSIRLVETPAAVHPPPPAAARIKTNYISSQVKENWNREIETLFCTLQSLDRRVINWGRSLLYGSPESSKGKASG